MKKRAERLGLDRLAITAGLLLLFLFFVGCFGDDCEPGVYRCNGNTAENCRHGDWTNDLLRTPCIEDYQCIILPGKAACAYEGAKYSSCPEDVRSDICLGADLQITCEYGYRTDHMLCKECDVDSATVGVTHHNCSADSYWQTCDTSSDCMSGLECLSGCKECTFKVCTRSCSSASDCYDLSFPARCRDNDTCN